MSYEINVSKNGQHYLATAERSINTLPQLAQILNDFREIYTPEKGFKITCKEWRTMGYEVDGETLQKHAEADLKLREIVEVVNSKDLLPINKKAIIQNMKLVILTVYKLDGTFSKLIEAIAERDWEFLERDSGGIYIELYKELRELI